MSGTAVTADTVVSNLAVYRKWLERELRLLHKVRTAWVGWGNLDLLAEHEVSLHRAATAVYVLDSLQEGEVWFDGSSLGGRTSSGIVWGVVTSRRNIPAPERLDAETWEALMEVALGTPILAYGVCS
jgi:hypothetical protein